MKMNTINICYVYILKCSDNTLYTGWTVDIYKRIQKHNRGKGAKYTRGRVPVELVYLESFSNKIDAQKEEYKIKKLNKTQKLKLIQN